MIKTYRNKIITIKCKTNFPVVQWTFNNRVPPSNVILTKKQLRIVNVVEENEGEYVCEARTNETYDWTMEKIPLYAKSVVKIVGMKSAFK